VKLCGFFRVEDDKSRGGVVQWGLGGGSAMMDAHRVVVLSGVVVASTTRLERSIP
jgi:hypothetical protein